MAVLTTCTVENEAQFFAQHGAGVCKQCKLFEEHQVKYTSAQREVSTQVSKVKPVQESGAVVASSPVSAITAESHLEDTMSEAVETKVPKKSLKSAIRELFATPGAAFTMEELVAATGKKKSDVNTVLSDLRNEKYAGKEGVLNTHLVDSKYSVKVAE